MCGVSLTDIERFTDLISMLDLNETIDQLAVTNSVRWYGHVLRREDGHFLRMVLYFEVEGQGKKGRPKRMWKRQVEEESVKVGLRRVDALCRSKWSVGVNKICCWVEVNLATLTCWGCYQILDIGVPLSVCVIMPYGINGLFGDCVGLSVLD